MQLHMALRCSMCVRGTLAWLRWELLAVVPLYDPPRHDTKDTIRNCIDKGIAVKMITGADAIRKFA